MAQWQTVPDPLSNILPNRQNGRWVDAHQILQNERYGCTITIPIRDEGTENTGTLYTIPCYMPGDFSFSLGNNWTSLMPDVVNMTSGISGLMNGINSVLNSLSTKSGKQRNYAQMQAVSREMQVLSWNGSEIPKFSVNCLFVATQYEYNPIDPILALCSTALPVTTDQAEVNQGYKKAMSFLGESATNVLHDFTQGKVGSALISAADVQPEDVKDLSSGIGNMVANVGMVAPLGFGVRISSNGYIEPLENTTCSLKIGNWFRAFDLVVTSISNIKFSKEVIGPAFDANDVKTGYPLYAECSIEFSPIKPIFYSEFLEYFTIKGNRNSSPPEPDEPIKASGGLIVEDAFNQGGKQA